MVRIIFDKNIYEYSYRYRDVWETDKPGGESDLVNNTSVLDSFTSAKMLETYWKDDSGTKKVQMDLPNLVTMGVKEDKLVSSKTTIIDSVTDEVIYEINLGRVSKIK